MVRIKDLQDDTILSWAIADSDGSQWVCSFCPKRGTSGWEVPAGVGLTAPNDLGYRVSYSVMRRLLGRVLSYADNPIKVKGV